MVVGIFGTFGEKVMRAKAKQLGQDFVNSLKNKLERSV
jgi:carbon monoxide dehydrogenase subunit G